MGNPLRPFEEMELAVLAIPGTWSVLVMRSSLLSWRFLPLALLALSPASASAVELAVERHELSNGLSVLLHEDHAVPVITFQVFYRCGGRDEVVGATGISHLLEHMMFNGSEHYPPKAFDRLLEAAGGSSNGYTWKDVTAYMETFPPAALELVLDMESDRMRALSITPDNLEQERGVVAEERRWAVDNDNDGAQWEALVSLMFQAHPYRDPVVGWMDDIQAITLEQVQGWYDACYAPANALIVMTGDFDGADVLGRLEAKFGKLEPGVAKEHPPWNEPEQPGLRYAELHRPAGQISIVVGWVGPGGTDPQLAALELVDHALSTGRSSLLVDTLVYEQGLFTDLSISFLPLDQASMFLIYGNPAEDVEVDDALAALDAVVAQARETPLPEARLARARRQAELFLYDEIETVEGRADALGTWELHHGGTEGLATQPDRWAALTAEEIRAAAARWLHPDRRNVVVLFPVEDEAEEGGEE